jgi:hypothetical protein
LALLSVAPHNAPASRKAVLVKFEREGAERGIDKRRNGREVLREQLFDLVQST